MLACLPDCLASVVVFVAAIVIVVVVVDDDDVVVATIATAGVATANTNSDVNDDRSAADVSACCFR